MRFESPKPGVLEDDLVQTFGRLEPQTSVFVESTTGPLLHRSEKLLYEPLARTSFVRLIFILRLQLFAWYLKACKHGLRSNSFVNIP
jgi:hypothetical protein